MERHPHPLDPDADQRLEARARWPALVSWLLLLLVLAFAVFIALVVFRLAVAWTLPALCAAAALAALWLSGRQHRAARFGLRAATVHRAGGIWWLSSSIVPRSRIQYVDLRQGPIERALGLARLCLYTAGTEHAEVVLEGLDLDRARTLRQQLLADLGSDGV